MKRDGLNALTIGILVLLARAALLSDPRCERAVESRVSTRLHTV